MAKDWLQHKRIVIIGGTAGMGLSAALACINEGAKVVVVGREDENAQVAAGRIGENGMVISADATREETAHQALEICKGRWGGCDGLYHVAGGSGRTYGDGPLHQISVDGWNYTIQLNLTSVMLSNRAAVQFFLREQQPGVILNMGSVLGFSPSPKFFTTHAYAAAKSAIIGFTKSIASYYAANNIRVNVLAPALIETPMSQRAAKDETILAFLKTKQPLDGGRVGLPEDVDGAAIFLLSDFSKFITGQVVSVDGGWSITEGQY